MAVADIKIEELGGGANTQENTGAIVHSKIYIAPLSHFDSLAVPKELSDESVTDVKDYVTIVDDHVFKTGYGFTVFKAIHEKSSFECTAIGNRSARAEQNKLVTNLIASDPTVAGYLRRHKNEDLIVLFETFGPGDVRQLGSEQYAAWISEKTTTIGETVEGDAMRAITITDKQLYEAPYYTGAIVTQEQASQV